MQQRHFKQVFAFSPSTLIDLKICNFNSPLTVHFVSDSSCRGGVMSGGFRNRISILDTSADSAYYRALRLVMYIVGVVRRSHFTHLYE